MTIKQIRISRKLQIVSSFFIHRRNYSNCPHALIQLHDLFGKDLEKIIEGSNYQPCFKDCRAIAKMIDKALEASAEITLRSKNEHKKSLDRFKTRLWILLEVLDKYCQLFHKESIW
jgi:hypothetical protein